jgi:hypothetical protein
MIELSAHRGTATSVAWCAVSGTAAGWTGRATADLRHPADPAFDGSLVALAAWVLLGCALWATVLGAAALVEAASHGRLRATTWVGCPRAARRVLLGGVGVVLVAAPAPAIAVGSSPPPGSTASLPVPARTVDREAPHRTSDRVVVRAGDCLWDLARSRLPPGASPDRVAALTGATYRRNRAVIGEDPDVIRAGQRLVLPRTDPSPRPQENP